MSNSKAAVLAAGIPIALAGLLRVKYGPTIWNDLANLKATIAIKKQADKLIANGVTIIDIFESHVTKTPEKTFLLFEDDSYTYAEIDQMANRMVRFIQHRGALECTDSAAIFMYNSPAFVTTWLALGKLGVKEVLLNYNLRARSLLHCIKSCDTKVVICGPGKSF